jgi:hypothetical protein
VKQRLSWTDRRSALLQTACNYVAEQVQSGVGICRAIRITARKFRGRSLGKPRRLRLSAKTFEGLWYRSKGGRDLTSFDLHYRPGRPKKVDPVFLRLIAETCIARGISIAAAKRELDPSNSHDISVHTLWRRLPPAKAIAELAALTRRVFRDQAILERRRREILETIQSEGSQ